MNIEQIKTNQKSGQMSCTAYTVYTFHLSLHHANFGQIKAKQVLSLNYLLTICVLMIYPQTILETSLDNLNILELSLNYPETFLHIQRSLEHIGTINRTSLELLIGFLFIFVLYFLS